MNVRRSRQRSVFGPVLITVALALTFGTAHAADPDPVVSAVAPGLCTTMERWQARGFDHSDPSLSTCPGLGTCDDPVVRDAYLVDSASELVTLRVHVIVFPEKGVRQAPLSPVDRKPMQRAGRRRVLALLGREAL